MSEVGSKGIGWWSEVGLIWVAGAMSGWVAIAGVAIAAAVVCWWRGFTFGLSGPDEVRRERLQLLGSYAVGPLAWLPVFAVVWVVRDGMAKGSEPKSPLETWFMTALTGMAIGVAALTLVSAWLAPVQIRARAAREGMGGVVISGVAGLPGAIVAGVLLGLGMFPAIVGLLFIAIDSLS
jgi:hypothetical protein